LSKDTEVNHDKCVRKVGVQPIPKPGTFQAKFHSVTFRSVCSPVFSICYSTTLWVDTVMQDGALDTGCLKTARPYMREFRHLLLSQRFSDKRQYVSVGGRYFKQERHFNILNNQ